MTDGSDDVVDIERALAEAFVRRSHELVGMGYARLDRTSLGTLDETAVTGKLCDAMEAVLDAPDRPAWATHVTVVDDQPETVGQKMGNRRPRTDVCVRCINPRPAERFRFEAKRLHDAASLGKYLGVDGMLALVTGHYGDLPRAGMIGYVQSGSCGGWRKSIKDEIGREPTKYRAVSPAQFADYAYAMPEPVFSSHHVPNTNGLACMVTHTLLLCN